MLSVVFSNIVNQLIPNNELIGFVTPRRTHIGAHAQIAQKSINCQVKNIFVSSAAQYLRPAVAAHVDSRWRHEHKTVQHHSKPYWTTSCDPRDEILPTRPPFLPRGRWESLSVWGRMNERAGMQGDWKVDVSGRDSRSRPPPQKTMNPWGYEETKDDLRQSIWAGRTPNVRSFFYFENCAL